MVIVESYAVAVVMCFITMLLGVMGEHTKINKQRMAFPDLGQAGLDKLAYLTFQPTGLNYIIAQDYIPAALAMNVSVQEGLSQRAISFRSVMS